MSSKAIRELATRIVASPEIQRKVALRKARPDWAATWAFRYAKAFVDSKCKDTLVEAIYVSRVGKLFSAGYGPDGEAILQKAKEQAEAASGVFDEMEAELEAVLTGKPRKKPEPESDNGSDAGEKSGSNSGSGDGDQIGEGESSSDDDQVEANLSNQDLRAVPVEKLKIHGTAKKKFAENGLGTVGNILDYAETQLLSEIDGVGESWANDTIAVIKSMAADDAIAANKALQD